MDLTPVAAPVLATDTVAKPKNAAQAAEQFEGLLLNQMLRSARSSDASFDSETPDTAQETMWDLAAQQFSQVLAHNGGLGLGKMIAASLQHHPPTQEPASNGAIAPSSAPNVMQNNPALAPPEPLPNPPPTP